MKNSINITHGFLSILYSVLILFLFEISLASCTQDELQIQQNFPFEISVMPTPKNISKDETVEIRFQVLPLGDYSETQYFLRYFQYDGSGTLQYFNNTPYLPNDLYPLLQKQFRLYYTSTSEISQSFTIWIIDNFGNEKEIKFQFNIKD